MSDYDNGYPINSMPDNWESPLSQLRKEAAEATARIAQLEQQLAEAQKQSSRHIHAYKAVVQERDQLKKITDRLETLAVKWIQSGHHDWQECKDLIQAKEALEKGDTETRNKMYEDTPIGRRLEDAFKAGQQKENEACAELVGDWFMPVVDDDLCMKARQALAKAIRARIK